MALSIAIIGAGWYGCHIGLSLKALGMSVTVFEQHARPLHEASGNNQFRLHQGFHYPRHHATRVQSRDGFMRFMERYPQMSRDVVENIYAVPREDSLIDFATYRLIMTSSGIDFREVKETSVALRGVDGIILAGERVLLIDAARRYFKAGLGSDLHLTTKVEHIEDLADGVYVNGTRFDILVDASWGHLAGLPMRFFYEPTILLYYETDESFPAVTLVDGPLCSIYPTEDPSLYTLSSVPFTPLGRVESAQDARLIRDSVTAETVAERRLAMEQQVCRYVPEFRERFRFVGPQFSIKSKPVGSFDDRSCYVFRRGRTFNVMSGKIDTIFFALERILASLEAGNTNDRLGFGSSLRSDIARSGGA
jgi:glycine/D-amino acid oxidase-like deaminating enzyme